MDILQELSVGKPWGVDYCIVYANDTKVKYLIGYYTNMFGITPLFNADGSLQIYNEE